MNKEKLSTTEIKLLERLLGKKVFKQFILECDVRDRTIQHMLRWAVRWNLHDMGVIPAPKQRGFQ